MRVTNVGLKIALLGLFTAACAGIFVYLYGAAGGKIRVSAPYQVTVRVPNAFQLVANADVRAAGVKVGVVNSVESDDGREATVELELKDAHAPIYRDARVLVRTKTLVGENYLDLEPGTPAAGKVPSKGTLSIDRAQDAVQLDQILSALDTPTRRAVSANLRNLGAGLGARGPDLNRLFGSARPAVATGGRALAILDAQRDAVARTIDNTGRVMAAIGGRRDDVRTLATSARRTAQAVASRDRRLGELLRALPSTLRQARSSTARLGAFAAGATPVARDLRVAARDLGPVMEDLGPSTAGARRLLVELPPLLRLADPLLQQLRGFSRAAGPAVGGVDAVLRQLNPALGHLKRYDREVGAFFANVGSALDTYDAVGNVARVHVLFGAGSFGGLSPSARSALDALTAAGGMTEVHQTRSNAYPQPGTVGMPRAPDGDYPRLQPLPG